MSQFRNYVYEELERRDLTKEWMAEQLGIQTRSLYVALCRTPVPESFKQRVLGVLHQDERVYSYMGRQLFVSRSEEPTTDHLNRQWAAQFIRDEGPEILRLAAQRALDRALEDRGHPVTDSPLDLEVHVRAN